MVASTILSVPKNTCIKPTNFYLIHAAGSKTRVRRESHKVRKLWAPSFHAYVPQGPRGAEACPCYQQNGKVVKIKKGTHVKEILASNPRT